MSQIDQLRNVFPSWPSELDVVNVPGNWAMRAQQFFCAASVLDKASEFAHQEMHGKELDEGLFMASQTQLPAQFCLAFSLELAIKSALVAQGKLDAKTNKEALVPGGHKLDELAQKIDGFDISPDEEKTLRWASEAILNGKYPGPKRPSDAKSGVPVSRPFLGLLNEVQPLYTRLMDMSTSN